MSQNIVYEALQSRLPNARLSPSGWTSFNAPCCQHRGHSPDTRKRGGIKMDGNSLVYHCFNCQYAAVYEPGQPLTKKMKDLMGWLGLSSELIRDITFYTSELVYRTNNGPPKVILPDDLQTLAAWAEQDCRDPSFLEAATFLQSFDPPKDLQGYFWTPDDHQMSLSRYIVMVKGSEDHPTAWLGFPLDSALPHLLNGKPDEPEDEDIPPETLKEMERLMNEDG